MTSGSTPDWRLHGVRIVRGDELGLNTPQTPGMRRAAAITHASAGANKLWAGTVTVHPNAKIVVMDNLTAHKGERVRELIEERGCELLYLPPYSPDLNPYRGSLQQDKRHPTQCTGQEPGGTDRSDGKSPRCDHAPGRQRLLRTLRILVYWVSTGSKV